MIALIAANGHVMAAEAVELRRDGGAWIEAKADEVSRLAEEHRGEKGSRCQLVLRGSADDDDREQSGSLLAFRVTCGLTLPMRSDLPHGLVATNLCVTHHAFPTENLLRAVSVGTTTASQE
jgi:hypothetical protein